MFCMLEDMANVCSLKELSLEEVSRRQKSSLEEVDENREGSQKTGSLSWQSTEFELMGDEERRIVLREREQV